MTKLGNFQANPFQPPLNVPMDSGCSGNSNVAQNSWQLSGFHGKSNPSGYYHVPMTRGAPVTTVFSGYQNIIKDSVSGNSGDPTDKSVKNVAGVTPKSATSSPTIVVNACLAFIKSEKQRKDQPAIIEAVSKHFTLNEIKSAREALFRGAAVGRYSYRPPNNPSTAHQLSAHCVGSIISKLNELEHERDQPHIKIVCPAEELFNLMNVHMLMYNPVESCSIEDRVNQLEREVKVLKFSANSINQWKPKPPVTPVNSRQNLISDIRNSNYPSTPGSASKRPRSMDLDPWAEVARKKNGVRPQKRSKPSFWGKEGTVASTDLVGAEINEVFLFNYRNIATEEVVKRHFEKHQINVLKVYQRSKEGSDVKSFVMKIVNKADFEKVVTVLPWQTGARWYERQQSDPAQRPSAYFNKVRDSDAFLLDRPAADTVTPAAQYRGASAASVSQQYYTPSRGPDTPVTAVSTRVSDEALCTPVRSATKTPTGFSVTSMITPLTATSSMSSAPAFRTGGPLSNVGESMSLSMSMPSSFVAK